MAQELALTIIFFSFGLITGIMPALLWSRMGGDDMWMQRHPKLALLTRVDHFEFGIILMVISSYFIYVAQTELITFAGVFSIALGTGLTIDDLLLHSFKGYWQRTSLFKTIKRLFKEDSDGCSPAQEKS